MFMYEVAGCILFLKGQRYVLFVEYMAKSELFRFKRVLSTYFSHHLKKLVKVCLLKIIKNRTIKQLKSCVCFK